MKHISIRGFFRHELTIAIIFWGVMYAIAILPEHASMSGQSPFYEKYYANSLPFSFFTLLMISFFTRLVIVSGIFFYYRRERKKPGSE